MGRNDYLGENQHFSQDLGEILPWTDQVSCALGTPVLRKVAPGCSHLTSDGQIVPLRERGPFGKIDNAFIPNMYRMNPEVECLLKAVYSNIFLSNCVGGCCLRGWGYFSW